MKKFYITTAIDYVNAKVHIGHSLEKIQADVLARYHRKLDEEVFFLTGTDENAQKNVLAAKKRKIDVKKFVDENANFAKKTWKLLNISFDYFIRTTNKKIHWPGVRKIWKLCKKSGDIYKKKYTGLYCSGCEAFLKEKDLKNGLCPYHLKKPEKITEENYFFKLSKYQKQLEKIIEKDKIKIFPKSRKNEILKFIKSGLEDFSISRPTKRMRGWGIPVPGDKSQTIYVWFDALINYLTGIGFGWNRKKFKKFWPADVHIIGKDILRFHAVYWPAMLLSAKIELPRAIFVHGFITVSGQKMSKSLGNIINPQDLVEKYGPDAVRYFFLREASPFEDVDFTFEKFERRYEFDLAHDLGNLVLRVVSLAKREKISFPKRFLFKDKVLKRKIEKTKKLFKREMEKFELNKALVSLWELISFSNVYIDRKKPWQRKDKTTIKDLLLTLFEISEMLYPFLPQTAQNINTQVTKINPQILFPRI